MLETKKLLSFVIPCYNSTDTISHVIDEICAAMEPHQTMYGFEIIAINDASPDNVIYILKELAAIYPFLKVIDLTKNFGKHAAVMAGFSKSKGDIVVCLDDDGQCPMDQVFLLLEKIEEGYDACFAAYQTVEQSGFKKLGSHINNAMAYLVLDKPLELRFSNFGAYSSDIVREILRYKNPYPYIEGLLLRSTQNIANIPLKERERIKGKTNFSFRKSFSLWVNGFTAFSVKPLRFATVTGIICAFIGFIWGIYTIIHKLMNPATPAGYSSVMAVLLFVGGMMMLMLGMIGEYIGRIYISINNSPQYVIRDTINLEDTQ